MTRFLAFTFIILALAPSGGGMTPDRMLLAPFTYDGSIPAVHLNHSAVELQRALYPVHYSRFDARADIEWADDADSLLERFWAVQGDTVLHLLAELSGLEWRERSIELYILRFFPSLGSPDPLVIPVGGMRRGEMIEAAPAGKIMKLNLIFQLARRMLDQPPGPGLEALAYHQLMRPGVYRRDNLALLLAVATAGQVLGADSAKAAWRSSFWRGHFPGMEIYEQYFAGRWALSPEKTLAEWVLAEKPGSELIEATQTPQRPERTERPRSFVAGLPLQGELGMAVSIHESGLLRVDKLDPYRAAYIGGLREGDLIRTVNGGRVQNHRQLAEKVIETLDRGGATVQYLREGKVHSAVVRPVTATGGSQ